MRHIRGHFLDSRSWPSWTKKASGSWIDLEEAVKDVERVKPIVFSGYIAHETDDYLLISPSVHEGKVSIASMLIPKKAIMADFEITDHV